MANKGKKETNKQITEVKQELQKELDKMNRVRSNIPEQQTEEAPKLRKKLVQPSTEKSLNGGKIKGIDFRTNESPKEQRVKAQKRKEERRDELGSIKPTSFETKSNIRKRDRQYKKRIETDKDFRESYEEGKLIEQSIIDDVHTARIYVPSNYIRQSWVLEQLKNAKAREGERNFYKRLQNNEDDIKKLAHTIAWASEQKNVSTEMDSYMVILFNLTDEEQKEMHENTENGDTDGFIIVDDEDDIPFV